ncbi:MULTISPECIES: ABC transporter substrate-binding protein [unclassified Bosea (in: a-proteobacteria)]|uniref:ABC transporter substrate-binding protein n=1 Tax=unclassified Bosea (in: a-proteobacteria) TaxID=2653178 RepID=UPI000F756343|nr:MULTISPECIES: ABC transporter substrate-binding protein [unclassified Bosea (in: a-proteobacteria)]AZO79277.1 amino acid ABC transporter substrate-binding protein [Bosea sp. Tri-49]RXT27320.1 amino acid ABC transporter substrate-binding protein [Bosea sp. Tri-39]RXT35975.1 amino acid ABC transporter substrate-binding protein [Bosea sp. Tri-54]
MIDPTAFPTRRSTLAMLAAVALPRQAQAAGLRIATIDWSVLETLLALGVAPVAAPELLQFREVAVEPQVPGTVTDLGLRGTVNFELLLLSRPELIYSSSFYASSEPRLLRIAPVERFSIYAPGRPPYEPAAAMMRSIGARLGIGVVAERYLAETEAEFAVLRERLKPHARRPVIPINLGDARHFRVFGADSMFGEVLKRLGLANAWTDDTSYSATAPVGLEALVRVPNAWIALIPPVPPGALEVLSASTFWNALPNLRERRLLWLAPINPYGGLPAARRFARLLTEALLVAEASRG